MYPIKHTPEQGHTKHCLAKSLITSIENWRDDETVSDHSFRMVAQDNTWLNEADEWLAIGEAECICPV